MPESDDQRYTKKIEADNEQPYLPDSQSAKRNPGALEIGSFIGGTYRVLDFIGQGGMGYVYKVEHLMMAKVMALKVLRSEQVSAEVWTRFRTEAQAIARLDHVNVVRIYDMSQTEAGLPYYTMDLLVGQSLADYLDDNGRIAVKEGLPIFRQVCAGLAYAHDRGIIHRDIKPGNIMLISEKENAPPVVKLVDFGIAKLSSFDHGFAQGLTRPGEVFGSPLYMSPEQCAGQPLDHRTDMYSVGVTMFQAFAGKPPLLGKTAIETTAMHLSVVPPAMAEVAVQYDDEEELVFPDQLEDIVACLLAKSPDDRYDSLADVAGELLTLERQIERSGRPGGNVSGSQRPGAITGRSAGRASGRSTSAGSNFGSALIDSSSQGITGQSDTATRQDNRQNFLVLALAAIVIVGVLGIGGIALFTAHQPAKKVPVVSLDQLPNPPRKESEEVVDKIIEEPPETIGPILEKRIKKYLATHRGFYSKETRIGNRTVYSFDFPPDFALGTLTYRTNEGPGWHTVRAGGHVEVPTLGGLSFDASKVTKAHPELLKFFRPDELKGITICDFKEIKPELVSSLLHCTSVDRLEMRNVPLRGEDLKWLNQMPALKDLRLDHSLITGEELAASPLLLKLRKIATGGIADLSPVLKKVAATDSLLELHAYNTRFHGDDWKNLSKLTHLMVLNIRDADPTDADLESLKPIKHLTILDISRCYRLTPKCVSTLENLHFLMDLSVTEELCTKKIERTLRRQMPLLREFKF